MDVCYSAAAFFLALLAFGVGYGDARHHVTAQSRPLAARTCLYENTTYPAGTKFRPDPCTFCHCPRRGGRPTCAIEDCRYDPDCVRYEKTTQSLCCDICVQHGCRDNDGNVYQPGEVVSTVSCTKCVCPEGGGRVECSHVTCPEVKCVDPVTEPGSCCPSCPNGPNCWLGKEKLPAGKVVKRSRCKTCKCPEDTLPSWMQKKGARAICRITECA